MSGAEHSIKKQITNDTLPIELLVHVWTTNVSPVVVELNSQHPYG